MSNKKVAASYKSPIETGDNSDRKSYQEKSQNSGSKQLSLQVSHDQEVPKKSSPSYKKTYYMEETKEELSDGNIKTTKYVYDSQQSPKRNLNM